MTPVEVVVEAAARKIVAPGAEGSFGLLPRHCDFVALLVPGLLSFESPDGTERFLAVDEGLLVKAGPEVWVTSWKVVPAGDLGTVRAAVLADLQERSAREQRARQALARLEAELVRRLGELERVSNA
jgi:F-type H+-transporting ATPase subunit epsilon